MKLILLDGGPASGKNTLGSLLVQQFQKQSGKAILANQGLLNSNLFR